jgi:hypothetical protein
MADMCTDLEILREVTWIFINMSTFNDEFINAIEKTHRLSNVLVKLYEKMNNKWIEQLPTD